MTDYIKVEGEKFVIASSNEDEIHDPDLLDYYEAEFYDCFCENPELIVQILNEMKSEFKGEHFILGGFSAHGVPCNTLGEEDLELEAVERFRKIIPVESEEKNSVLYDGGAALLPEDQNPSSSSKNDNVLELKRAENSGSFIVNCSGSENDYVSLYIEFHERIKSQIKILRDARDTIALADSNLYSLTSWCYDFEVIDQSEIVLDGEDWADHNVTEVESISGKATDFAKSVECCQMIILDDGVRFEFYLKHDSVLIGSDRIPYSVIGV